MSVGQGWGADVPILAGPYPLSCPLCRTPLMLAIMNGHVDCVHLLLEKGSTADAADLRGRTALHRGVSELLGGVVHSQAWTWEHRLSSMWASILCPGSYWASLCLLQDEYLTSSAYLPDYLAL